MAQHRTAKIRAESDFGETPFSLDSSEAKRITALNAREERRLEEVHRKLEKQRTTEKKRFLKAQKDTVINLFTSRKVHSTGKIYAHERLTMDSGWATSRELLRSISEHFDPQCLIPEKNNSKSKRKYSQKVGVDYSNIASASYSGLLHDTRILASEGNLIQRCRSWSSRVVPNFRFFGSKVSNDQVTTKQSNSSAKKSFIQENSTDAVESRGITKERSLSEVLPPVRLPPLHSLKEKTLKEKRNVSLKMANKIRNEELWAGLENCRYIRRYVKK